MVTARYEWQSLTGRRPLPATVGDAPSFGITPGGPMTDAAPAEPMTNSACPKCNQVHDPTKCKAHSKLQRGAQCQLPPMSGQDICGSHGGRARQNKAAAAQRVTEQEARKTLGRLTVAPIENPLAELQLLAGEAVAWKQVCADHMAVLERMRYGTEGGEAIRGEIILFERALDRCGKLLVDIAKLNIDERLARVSEMQLDLAARALTAWLAEQGMTTEQQQEAKRGVARHLRLIAG